MISRIAWDEARYPIATSSRIARHNHATGRLWYSAGHLFSQFDSPARTRGSTALVSGRSILAHTIAVALTQAGVSPKLACAAARRFTDIADPHEAPGFSRAPGQLFEGSFTYLAVYPDGDVKVIRTAGKQVWLQNKATGERERLIEKPAVEDLLLGAGKREGCWLLPLDFIVKHVEIELQKANSETR
jgi:hypothetical protein